MTIDEAITELKSSSNIRFKRLITICTLFFGEPRTSNGGSHRIFKTKWIGDPRINLQKDGKDAKKYQLKQVIQSLEKLRGINDVK